MRPASRSAAFPVLLWQLVARFPTGMLTIALLTWGESRTSSYAAGGALVAAFTLGFAVGSSVSARLFTYFGAVRVLALGGALSATGMVTLVTQSFSTTGMLAITAAVGLTFPPVTPVARSIYPRLSLGQGLLRIYGYDSVAQESIWILGPLLTVGVAGTAGPGTAIVACAVTTLVGTLAFVSLGPTRRFGRGTARQQPGTPKEIARPAVPTPVWLLLGTSFFLVSSGAFIEVHVLAEYGYHSIRSGIILMLVAVGSLLGGLTLARRRIGRYSLALRLTAATGGMLVAASASDTLTLALALFVSGIGIAPSFAAMNTIIALQAPPQRSAEVYAYSNTAQLIGQSTGSALAGVLTDLGQGSPVLLTGALCAALAGAISIPAGRRLIGFRDV